jgi:AcrR family transcriptional regulator
MARQSTAGSAETLEEARRPGREAKPAREAAQRELLLRAMTRAVAASGYEGSRVDDVVELSGLSRATFYRHFEDRDECFSAAFEWWGKAFFKRIEKAVQRDGDLVSKVEAALRELVDILSREPEAAHLVLVEARAGDSATRKAQLRWLRQFAGLLSEADESSNLTGARVLQIEVRADDIEGAEAEQQMLARIARLYAVAEARSEGPPTAGIAGLVVGALTTLLASTVAEKGVEALPRILSDLTYIALSPYLGVLPAIERARRAETAK